MKKPEKTNGSQALVQHGTNGNADGLSSMLEEFAGLYQAGYEAGYSDARKQGNASTDTAVAVATNASGIRRPRRLLLGLPCPNCRIYSSTDEALCPCCKTPKVSAQNGRNQFAVTGDTSVSLKNIAASTRRNRH